MKDDGELPKQANYGIYKNVTLSDDEYRRLKFLFPSDYQGKIDYLSSYMASTGRKYSNHYLTILKWAKQDEQRMKDQAVKKKFEDYDNYEKGKSY